MGLAIVAIREYEGPEFRLEYKDYSDDIAEVAMSIQADRGRAALEHYGAKGMKWGVRKEKVKAGLKRAGLAIGDHLWEQNAYSSQKQVQVHNAMADHFNTGIDKINAKPAYNKNLLDPKNSSALRAYDKEANELQHQSYEHAAKNVLGSSPSGKKKAVYNRSTQTVEVRTHGGKDVGKIQRKEVKHANDDLQFKVKFDKEGKIVQLNYAKLITSVAQGEEFVNSLMHYGIKGQKWGHITGGKSGDSSAKEVATTSVVNAGLRSKTKIKATGGQNHPAAADAIKAAASKQKLQKSGPKALSNKELQELSTRLNLEQQVSQLTAPKGTKFVKNLVKNEGQNQVRREVSNQTNKAVEGLRYIDSK